MQKIILAHVMYIKNVNYSVQLNGHFSFNLICQASLLTFGINLGK